MILVYWESRLRRHTKARFYTKINFVGRLLKQFIYGFVYLLVLCLLGLVGLGVYNRYSATPQSCSDNIQNQQESEIDCGGPLCVSCELKHLNLQINEPVFFNAGQFKTTAVVKITNPSFNYNSKSFNYEFQVINKFGGAIATRSGLSGTSYISAGESKYLIAPAIDIDPRDVGRVVVNIPNVAWDPKTNLTSYSLSFKNLKPTFNNKSPQISGILKNNSASSYRSISIVGVLFNKQGDVVNASATKLDHIQSFGETPFTIFYPVMNNIAAIDVASISPQWFSYEVSR